MDKKTLQRFAEDLIAFSQQRRERIDRRNALAVRGKNVGAVWDRDAINGEIAAMVRFRSEHSEVFASFDGLDQSLQRQIAMLHEIADTAQGRQDTVDVVVSEEMRGYLDELLSWTKQWVRVAQVAIKEL